MAGKLPKETDALVNRGAALLARAEADAGEDASWQSHLDAGRRQLADLNAKYEAAKNAEAEARRAYLAAHGAAGDSGAGRALDALTEELARKKSALDAAARTRNGLEATADTITGLLTQLNRSGFAVEKELWPQRLTAEHLPALTEALARIEKPLEEKYFAARQASADLAKEQEALRAELNAVSGGKWVYPHGDAATKVRDAVNAELKSRGMTADAKIFCELLTVADESWQDCVEACLGDRRFDILVPPAHYAAAKSAFVALGDRVGPISLLDTPGIRKADRHAETAPADSLAAQVTSENPLAAQYADTILRRIVCCDTPDTLEHFPDSATRDLLRHHPFRLERLRRPQRYIGLDARRERADALEAQLAAQTDRCREAAQTEKTLKSAYDQYQNVLRGHALEQLAELWASRAALDAARADYAAQEQKLADCRENPMLQQLYREEEAREAAWEAARKAVEQVGGDIRVCEKQIASCEVEQSKGGGDRRTERGRRQRHSLRQHPLLEPLAQERKKGLMTRRAHGPCRRTDCRKGTDQAGRCPAGLSHFHAGTCPEGLQRALCLRLSAGSGRGGAVPRPAREPCPHRSGTLRRPAGAGTAGLQGPLPQGYPLPDEGRYLQRPPPVPGAEQGDGAADLRRGSLPL